MTLLCVVAHPDDECFAFGGALALATDRGIHTHVICFTDGQAASARGTAQNGEELGRMRRQEFAASCALLGVTGHEVLDFGDGQLEFADFSRTAGLLVRRMRELQPDTVLTFGADGGLNTHSDHMIVSALTTAAFHWAGRPGRTPELGAPFQPSRLFHLSTNFFVPDRHPPLPEPWTVQLDIRSAKERKLAAFRLHTSQAPLVERTRDLFEKHGDYEFYTLAASPGGRTRYPRLQPLPFLSLAVCCLPGTTVVQVFPSPQQWQPFSAPAAILPGYPLSMGSYELSEQDPIAIFREWMRDAEASEPNDPNAVALATSTVTGAPSVRMVLVKRYDEHGLCFFTNAESQKGRELTGNAQAAMCFHWKSLRRQIRLEGAVVDLPDQDVDAYFHSRSRRSQLGAAVSDQSRPLPNRELLEDRVRQFEAEHPDEVPRPPYWRGYCLIPSRIEFWMDGPDRLHDRFLFTRTESGWSLGRLYP